MDIVEEKHTAKATMQSMVSCLTEETAKATEVITIRTIVESERRLFVRMFMHWLHKNRKRIFILADKVSSLQSIKHRIAINYKGITIVETATLEEHGVSDDMILNRINGAEADCIIVSLPKEVESAFVEQNRKSLNTKVWFALGCEKEWKKQKNLLDKMKSIFSDMTQKSNK